MAIIHNLPSEILHDIVSHLGSHDLFATSLVSHSFYMISQCLLYQEPILYLDDGNWFYDEAHFLDIYDKSPVPGSVTHFLRTLLLAPGRETTANYVRNLTVDLEGPQRPAIHVPDIVLLSAAALNLGLDARALDKYDAQIVLIIHLLPRLTSLELLGIGQVPFFGTKLLKDLLTCPATR